MPLQARVVPWSNPEQFKKVHKCLYDEDITLKRWAVEQIAVWGSRCMQSLPFAVEATTLVVRAQIQNMLYEADKSFCQATEIEMMCATAIVRFVNLIMETLLDGKNVENAKLIDAAEELNIPPWIVHVRHNITHRQFPSLPLLLMACETIFEYLNNEFWIPEVAAVSSYARTFSEPYKKLICDYKMYQLDVIARNYIETKKMRKHFKPINKRIENILCKPERREFLEMLTNADTFVTDTDIKLIKNDDLFLCDKEDEENVLPKSLKRMWVPMVRILHRCDCLSEFLELLLINQENRKRLIEQKIVDLLVIHVLSIFSLGNDISCEDTKEMLKPEFFKKGPLIEYNRLLYACVKGSSNYSKWTYKRLSSILNIGKWKQELWMMVCIKQGLAVRKTNDKGEKRKLEITFTVGDLKTDIHSEWDKRKQKCLKNHWSVAPYDIDFATKPIGHVFNPVIQVKEEEPRQEIDILSSQTDKVSYIPSPEESKPLIIPNRETFIFDRRCDHSSLIYRRERKN